MTRCSVGGARRSTGPVDAPRRAVSQPRDPCRRRRAYAAGAFAGLSPDMTMTTRGLRRCITATSTTTTNCRSPTQQPGAVLALANAIAPDQHKPAITSLIGTGIHTHTDTTVNAEAHHILHERSAAGVDRLAYDRPRVGNHAPCCSATARNNSPDHSQSDPSKQRCTRWPQRAAWAGRAEVNLIPTNPPNTKISCAAAKYSNRRTRSRS